MPGNIKRIEGAGKYGGYYGDSMSLNQTEQVTRGMSGGRIGAGAITFEGYKDHINLPVWEDRNTDNIGSKLNGPKNKKTNLKKQSDYKYKKATKKANG